MSRLSPEQTTRSPVLNRASAERSPTPSVQERAKAILQQPARGPPIVMRSLDANGGVTSTATAINTHTGLAQGGGLRFIL